jgi:hypothetical protein
MGTTDMGNRTLLRSGKMGTVSTTAPEDEEGGPLAMVKP